MTGRRDAGECGVDCRCDCGSLLARWRDGAVELKCRRCKRRIRLEAPSPGQRALRVTVIEP